jgi:hypothetical protein
MDRIEKKNLSSETVTSRFNNKGSMMMPALIFTDLDLRHRLLSSMLAASNLGLLRWSV